MRKMRRLLVCALAVLLAAGCVTQTAWVYQSNHYPPRAETGTKRAVVLPFEDRRNDINHDYSIIAMLPLVPYGRVVEHVPPDMELLVKPRDYFAKALAADLRATDRYRDAYFSSRIGKADYVFKGEILNTDYIIEILTYGLSMFAAAPWIVGLPASKITNDLSLRLGCSNPNGEILFQKTYAADPYEVYQWMYYVRPNINYPHMAAQIYRQFVADLIANGKCM
ncbi:MAG TPA: hypothetical protein VMV27_01385 [Candidatus Binataceae bacterium]|nr:hypothetical protein [Candidatus Binataceae bacterium]